MIVLSLGTPDYPLRAGAAYARGEIYADDTEFGGWARTRKGETKGRKKAWGRGTWTHLWRMRLRREGLCVTCHTWQRPRATEGRKRR